jgi:hypothetical protein
MEINLLAILAAALSTMVVGSIWYNPKVFGIIWMRESGVTPEKARTANMLKTFGLAIVFAFMISFILQMIVIHQFGALGLVGGDPALAKPSYAAFMADYGDAFRTFKHGAFHGFITGLFLALPIIATNSLFEMKSWRHILINAGYWMVNFTIMGGILSAWK